MNAHKAEWEADWKKHPAEAFSFQYSDYSCHLIRNPYSKTYCGYVQLPPDHPDYSKKYDDLQDQIGVHGGLTYGGGNGKFGFDCHHMMDGDVSPADAEFFDTSEDALKSLFDPTSLSLDGTTHYWTFEEAMAETQKMARQFRARHV